MGKSFGEKLQDAITAERIRRRDPHFGLRTIARTIAKDDPGKTESWRRWLQKYRPPKGGGSAALKNPRPETRWEVEDALGLERDTLAPDVEDLAAHAEAIEINDLFERLTLRILERQERREKVA